MYLFSCRWIRVLHVLEHGPTMTPMTATAGRAHGQVFKAPDQSPAFQGGLPKQGQLREDSTL